MAEIYQNPSLFSGSLAPPSSLIPEAPKPDNDNWASLLSLLNQGLPIMPIIQAALNGQISVADAVNRATYPGGYNNSQNVPFQVPNPFALDATNAPPSIQNLLGGPPPTTTTQPPAAPHGSTPRITHLPEIRMRIILRIIPARNRCFRTTIRFIPR